MYEETCFKLTIFKNISTVFFLLNTTYQQTWLDNVDVRTRAILQLPITIIYKILDIGTWLLAWFKT